MKKKLPRWAVPAAVAAGIVLAAAIAYLVLISPQKKKATSLQREIEQTQVDVARAEAALRTTKKPEQVRVADLFKLSKAMPGNVDMPGVLLQLNRVATDTGVTFKSITPHSPISLSGYQTVPIDLVFDGNYFDLSDFLYRIRNLVDVRHGELDSRGRLFTVDSLAFVEGEKHFPDIQASLTVNAYVYGAGAAGTTGTDSAPATTAATTTGSTDTTSTAPTTTTAPAPAPAGATAAGANP